jgi:hypothetical protein
LASRIPSTRLMSLSSLPTTHCSSSSLSLDKFSSGVRMTSPAPLLSS